MRIVIIGSGNVAYALARKIKDSSHELLQVAGRNPIPAARMGKELEALVVPLTSLNKEADLYIVAIADDALNAIGNWLKLDRKLVVHTAGSVSKDILKGVSKNYGVLYPLQSLKAGMEIIPEIPFLVDGNTPDDLALIRDFAYTFSDKVEVANDEERLKLHLAAVVVNNFSNHLYALAEKFCLEEDLRFELLHPLILETAKRLANLSAKDTQTGPAVRKDASTIEKQKRLLDNHPALKRIYEEMTKSIEEFYK
jgi:predicted short-subunit dehydrogenase-like oxidoreductase (DUF2520 family)